MEIKIGMVAPSRAGKTSILSAILMEVKERLSGNVQGIQFSAADEATNTAMKRAISNFKACTAGAGADVFEVPQIQGSQSIANYKFAFTIPVPSGSGSETLSVDIMDYPGGYLGTSRYDELVVPFLNECCALVVPIPSDLLMELASASGRANPHSVRIAARAREMLEIDNVVAAVRDWVDRKVQADSLHQVIFVPLRCEKYFNDNGGHFDEHGALFNAVEKFYVKELASSISGGGKHLKMEILAVDTYGIVELSDVVLSEDGNELVSTFSRRVWMEHRIQPKFAFELLVGILHLQLQDKAEQLGIDIEKLEEEIRNRDFFEDIWKWIFGDLEKKRKIEEMARQKGSNEAIAVLKGLYDADASDMRCRVVR